MKREVAAILGLPGFVHRKETTCHQHLNVLNKQFSILLYSN